MALVVPDLAGRFDGYSLRVPTPTVSVVDFVATLKKETDTNELRAILKRAARTTLKGIMACEEERLVSMDFNHDPHSSIFHMDQTKVMEGTSCRILTWYDNEWGFSNRMADTAVAMGALL